MSKPRTYQTEAIIIKKTKLGEAGRILTLYTPHLGKIQAVAKGVRRPRSKMAGHLELLTHSQISLARGRNIDTITGTQTINGFLPLKSDLELSACALYATELVNQFAADDVEDYPVFQLLLATLQRLSQRENSDLVLRYFELQLLNAVGYRPQLEQCVACRKPLEETTNSFCPGAGGMLCVSCRPTQPFAYPLSLEAQKALRSLQDGDYESVSRMKLEPALSHQLEVVIRNYIRYLLERDLKSAAWLDALKAQSGQANLSPAAPT
ncbi:MAG: DNA repair protein RecO [Chloroflexi bacterium]|nr:DNA repair protein RecO [Chloroflexota bacterium]